MRRGSSRPGGIFDAPGLEKQRAELSDAVSRPDFWDEPERARAVTKRLSEVEADVTLLDAMQRRLEDARTLDEMAREAGDDDTQSEACAELDTLEREFDACELRSLYFGEYDARDAIVEIHPGAGGTESQDWGEMLLRMYLRWAERSGFDVEIDEYQPGDEAGLKSVTFTVRGRNAYGSLLAERGVHRLVLISPFDAAKRRHTSFTSVDVIPVFEEEDEDVEIRAEDLRIDTYRSSGAGGQHVNVTDSAVRITHEPSGIVVSCQNERSQLQNRARAMQILRARLAQRRREERDAELDEIRGEKSDIGWGSQIRSYVLAPYQMVKDLRTGHETGNPNSVLDGEISPFVEAWLRWRRSGESRAVTDDLA
ncbi:MAG: peptide chain release factor 2 [Acidimicrobiia bacterium]|nr:peptide chain release factor 2 [Acidimicrobiia bacterium]